MRGAGLLFLALRILGKCDRCRTPQFDGVQRREVPTAYGSYPNNPFAAFASGAIKAATQ